MQGNLAILILCVLAAVVSCHPANPAPRDIVLPDGTTLTVRAFGDEYSGEYYQDQQGFAIIFTEAGWAYVTDGASMASQPIASANDPRPETAVHGAPLGWQLRGRKAREESAPRRAQSAERMAASRAFLSGSDHRRGERGLSVTGQEPLLVILVQWSAYAMNASTVNYARSKFFGASDSVKHWYTNASGGNFTFNAATEAYGYANDGIVGPVTVTCTQLHVINWGQDADYSCVVQQSISAANPYVDFQTYDTNNDGTVTANELHIVLVVAGSDGNPGQGANCPAVWGHQASGNIMSGVDGKIIDSYLMIGENSASCSFSNVFAIGVPVHELGHSIGLPDLYDTDYGGSIVGSWCSMDTGLYANNGKNPVIFSAFLRYYLGWAQPTYVESAANYTLAPAGANSNSILRFLDNPNGVDWSFYKQSGTGEYFLVENRQPVGLDAYIASTGVLVWHIDERAPVESNKLSHALMLARIVEPEFSMVEVAGDNTDTLNGQGGVLGCEWTDSPNSYLNNGRPSCVTMTATGYSSLNAKIAAYTPACGGCTLDARLPVPLNTSYVAAVQEGYTAVDSTGWTSVPTSTSSIAMLGFNMTIFDRTVTRVFINPEGFLSIEGTNTAPPDDYCPTNDVGILPVLAPLSLQYDDLASGLAIKRTSTTCKAPYPAEPCFITQWKSTNVSFEIILMQSGTIFFVYDKMPATVTSARVYYSAGFYRSPHVLYSSGSLCSGAAALSAIPAPCAIQLSVSNTPDTPEDNPSDDSDMLPSVLPEWIFTALASFALFL